AVDGVGADGFLHVHRREVAEQHRGRPHLGFAQRHHRELQREAAGLVDAALDVLGQLAERGIAGRQLRPGVADPDHRPPVEHLVRQAQALEPAAVVETLLAVATEPLLAAARGLAWSAHAVGDPARGEGMTGTGWKSGRSSASAMLAGGYMQEK